MSATSFVFLDRDGTLVEDSHYGHRREDYSLLPGTIPALKLLSEHRFRFVIVTNQSGIGRGYFSLDDYERYHQLLLNDLTSAGIEIAATYMCPHLPTDHCDCRKPSPASLRLARDHLGADLATSWMIGDHVSDVEAGHRAGCRSILVLTGHGEQERAKLPAQHPALICKDLLEAAHHIVLSST